MAHRLTLQNRPHGLPWIWNVDAHVGDDASSPNRSTDVELAKVLVMGAIAFAPLDHRPLPQTVKPLLVLNGQMDQTLAYWLYRCQARAKMPVVDGIFSPVARTAGARTAVLVELNYTLRFHNPTYWEGLPTAPGLSNALRKELMRSA